MYSLKNRIFSRLINGKYSALYLILTLLIFLLTFIKRNYYLVTSPLFIDPWVGLGYGQTFPERAFQWHYYKESRIIHSIFTHMFFLDSSFYTQLILGSIIVTATSIVFIASIRLSGIGQTLSILLGILISLSPWLWGDSAGGFDYYNTFGNLYIALSLYFVSSYYFKRKSFLNLFASGFLISLIIIEVPSGILYCSWLVLVFLLGNLVDRKRLEVIKDAAADAGKILSGVISFFLLELLTLKFFNEDSNRILTGLKTLLDIITQKESQKGYWIKLNLVDFFNSPGVSFFTFLFFSLTILFIYNSKELNKKFDSNASSIKIFSISALILCSTIIILQLFGKTIALTTSYFTIPVLFVLIFTVSLNLEVSTKSHKLNFFVGCASVIMFWVIKPTLFIFCTLLAFIFLLYLLKQKIAFRFIMTFLIIISLIFSSGVQIPTSSAHASLHKCEESRFEWRMNSLKIMNFIDTITERRGELVMGFDPSVFDKQIQKSNCTDLLNYQYAYLLATLSYQGILAANVYGPLSKEQPLISKYGSLAENFLSPKDREFYAEDKCTLLWAGDNVTNSDSIIILNINGDEFYGSLLCANSAPISKVLALNFRI